MSRDPGRPDGQGPTGPDGPAGPEVDTSGAASEPPPPSLREQAVVGVFWAAAQKWLVRISTLLAFILLGRLLTPVEFGVVALAMTIITVLSTVTDAGFTLWLVQKRRLTDEGTSTAFWISVALGLVLATALVIAAGPIADAFDSDQLRVILPVLAVAVVVAGLSGVPAALLQRELRFKELAVRQVLATLLSVLVAVGLAFAGAGVWALVAQTLVRVSVAAVVLWWTSDFRPSLTFSGTEAVEMTRYGSKSLGVQLGSALREQGESFMIGALVSTTALGLWTVAGRLVLVVVELGSAAVGSVAAPVFAKVQDDRVRLSRAFGRFLSSGSLVLVPALVALALASSDLVPLVFGPQWVRSGQVADVLAVGMLFTGLGNFHRGALLATGRAGAELWATALAIAGQVVIIAALAGTDLVTIAAGLSAWAAVSFLLRSVLLHRLLGIGARAYGQTLAVLLAAGVAALAVVAVDLVLEPTGVVRLLWVGLLGGPVFVLSAWLLARRTVGEVAEVVLSLLRRRRGARATGTAP